jgi:hypothetical protein
MNNTAAMIVKGGICALVLAMGTGCQSNKALDEVRALAQKADQNASAAQTTANAAGASAASAASAANAARSAADSAQSTANQALQAAQAAQASADAANEKVDRAFKKSVSK